MLLRRRRPTRRRRRTGWRRIGTGRRRRPISRRSRRRPISPRSRRRQITWRRGIRSRIRKASAAIWPRVPPRRARPRRRTRTHHQRCQKQRDQTRNADVHERDSPSHRPPVTTVSRPNWDAETGRNHSRPALGWICSMRSHCTFIVARASTPKAPEAKFDDQCGAVERT